MILDLVQFELRSLVAATQSGLEVYARSHPSPLAILPLLLALLLLLGCLTCIYILDLDFPYF